MDIIKIIKSDVLVIGSGGAGLRCAIELFDSNIDVLVVGKCKKRGAHTTQATGGINAALGSMDPKDSWQLHAADTIRDGDFINDTDGVIALCKNAPYAVRELDRWGTRFHKEANGRISQRFFGAATYRRACFVGDETGKEILNVLVDQAEKRKIRFKQEIYIFSLLHNKGKVNGAVGLDIRAGKLVVFHSKIVVLATGGHSRMFKRSSSHFWENNGDGIALANGLNAKFMDMEMFQFHPTGMLWPYEVEGLLVTEAVRGEGGILTNVNGERFMKSYDSKRMELSARDIVSRAIYSEVMHGRGTKRGGVFLDISRKQKSYILERLPKVYQQLKKYNNIDISKQKMEVGPTAHYSMGGILIDHSTGKTGIPNLFAIGEVTAGMHGANRLGGNSLAEIIVFGRLTGKNAAREAKKSKLIKLDNKLIDGKAAWLNSILQTKGKDSIQAKRDLQKMMWESAGVVRTKSRMEKGLKELKRFSKMKLNTGANMKLNQWLIAALDIHNMLPVCEMILKSALMRKESRGAHYRSDYESTGTKWKKNIICQRTKGGISLKTRQVKKVPKEISRFFKQEKAEVKKHLE